MTPSYNQGRYLEETIRSILLQGYPDLEYLVLDGGSTDGSPEIIRKYAPWLTFWTSQPDRGQSAAINRGLRMGTGLLANWINSDDLLCRNALLLLAKEAPVTSETMQVGVCVHIDACGRILSFHQGKVHSIEDLLSIRSVWRSGGFIDQPAVLFPRDLFLSVGGLEPANHFTMDYELWGKFLLSGANFQYTSISAGAFRVHAEQKTGQDLRQTDALVRSVQWLLNHAQSIPEREKEKILKDLLAYQSDFRKAQWRGTGRLARLGLPRVVVRLVRKAYFRLGQRSEIRPAMAQTPSLDSSRLRVEK